MKMTYSAVVDALAVELDPTATSVRTVPLGPDYRADFDDRGRIIALEILNASQYYDIRTLEKLESPMDP